MGIFITFRNITVAAKYLKKHVKEQTKVSKGNKSYGDYDWVDLYRSGKLRKLYSTELDKYIKQHGMEQKTCLTKKDKLSRIESLGLNRTKEMGYLMNYKIMMIRV